MNRYDVSLLTNQQLDDLIKQLQTERRLRKLEAKENRTFDHVAVFKLLEQGLRVEAFNKCDDECYDEVTLLDEKVVWLSNKQPLCCTLDHYVFRVVEEE